MKRARDDAPSVPMPGPGSSVTNVQIQAQQSVYGAANPNTGKVMKYVMKAADHKWEDQSLAEWDPNDFRIFVGDLGNECTDEVLRQAFAKYPSLQKAKVVRDKLTTKTKGYGFVSFRDPHDGVKALREMNGKYIGNRPVKLRKSSWESRVVKAVEVKPEAPKGPKRTRPF